MPLNTVLTIASSDPSGQTGIQSDLKTFSFAKIHGASVVTCISTQNRTGFQEIYSLDLGIIETQLESIVHDLLITATKTGMLSSQKIIYFLSNKIQEYGLKTIVDPLMTLKADRQHIQENILNALIRYLIPHAYLVTPNIDEAMSLTQTKIDDIKTIKKACEIIKEMGPQFVLITGGKIPGKYVRDVLYDGKKYTFFSLPRIKSNAQGAGYALSALITGYVAQGIKIAEAIEKAKRCIWGMMYYGLCPGNGDDVINHRPPHHPPLLQDHYVPYWIKLQDAIDHLLSFLPLELIPEVGINFAYALPTATQTKDVLGISGRIIKKNKKPYQAGEIHLGGSKHISSIILTCMKQNPNKRTAMNIAYSSSLLTQAKKKGWKMGSFDREKEPPNRKTMDWGTQSVIESEGHIPDLIWDAGAPGKEPMVRVISETPQGIIGIIKSLTENY
jgi:hydroxymethylpyrimidine/phosphomethylpyrimidine kinase